MPGVTSDLYEPLRSALMDEYEVEAVVRETPEVAVYLARDRRLNRRVVIEAVDPALAPDGRVEAFQREARTRAGLGHPGIRGVHRAGAIRRFHYVVLEYVGGETLEERLRRGPLTRGEALRLADLLLDALGAIHRAGLVHREIGRANVLVAADRYVLDGLARIGPAASADEVAADVHAAAALLVRASGGTERDPTAKLPKAARSALGRALSTTSSERPTAGDLRAALLRPRHRRPRRRPLVLAAGVVVAAAGAVMVNLWQGESIAPRPPPRELAIVPLVVDGGPALDPLGADLAQLLQLNLEDLPGVALTPRRQVEIWWARQGRDPQGVDWAQAARDLRVHWVARGLVDRRTDDVLRVRLILHDSTGARSVLPEAHALATDLAALGDSLTLQIIRVVAPRADGLYGPVPGLASVPLAALKAFLQGEAAFAQDAWAQAQGYYEIALANDSTFGLAEWRLTNVKRWRRLPYEGDLQGVYRRHASRLRPRDRMLIEGLLETDLERRLELLDAAVEHYPADAYTWLLLGEELFHRGPLAGRGLDQAVGAMQAAVARDPALALAHDHLVLAAVRLGHRSEAAKALALRRGAGRSAHQDDLDLIPFLELVYDERFVPWRAWVRHKVVALTGNQKQLAEVERVARMGSSWLGMPHTQLRYSALLLGTGSPSAGTSATGHEGKGLALYALGRPFAALAEFDSAAALLDIPEARLQQAEWRVIPPALGLPKADTSGTWRRRLEELAADSVLGARAAWALALAAQSAGDTTAAQRWIERLAPATPLRALLEARRAALRGDLALALALSDSVRIAFQSPAPPDRFAAAAFHLLRGDWLAALGHHARADAEWMWYEASDVYGWPGGLAQSGEVNAALGTFARLKRARMQLVSGASASDSLRGCAHLARIAELWEGAEPAVLPLAREAAALHTGCRT